MSTGKEEDIKRWTARRKAALVLEIIQAKKTVAAEAESLVGNAKNAPKLYASLDTIAA